MKCFYLLAVVIIAVKADSSTIVVQPSPISTQSAAVNNENSMSSTPGIAASASAQENQVSPSPSPSATINPTPSSSASSASSSVSSNKKFIKLNVDFEIVNEVYTNEMKDNSSSAFGQVENNLKSSFDGIYENDTDYFSAALNFIKPNQDNNLIVTLTLTYNTELTENEVLQFKLNWMTGYVLMPTMPLGTYQVNKTSIKVVVEHDGVWGQWSNSGDCDSSTKKQTQIRTCEGLAGQGKPCEGNSTQQIDCTPLNSSGAPKLTSIGILCALMIFFGNQIS